MIPPLELRTPRLRLRRWREEDLAPFAALNADSRVAEFLPKPLSREESDSLARRCDAFFDKHGYGLFAVEVPGVADFIGFTGLAKPSFEAPFMPAVEVGWRIAAEFWGSGYATEGARAALRFGFQDCDLDEIISFTVPANRRSRAVMERLGLPHCEADDFDHPNLAANDPLRRHVLHRLSRDRYEAKAGAGLRRVPELERPALYELVEPHLAEISSHRERKPGPERSAEYEYLPLYWREPGRHPFFTVHGGERVGFVLVREVFRDGVIEMSEFYICPEARRQGLGAAAAAELWRRFPGSWRLQVHRANAPACAFWQRVIEAPASGEIVAREVVEDDGRRCEYGFDV